MRVCGGFLFKAAGESCLRKFAVIHHGYNSVCRRRRQTIRAFVGWLAETSQGLQLDKPVAETSQGLQRQAKDCRDCSLIATSQGLHRQAKDCDNGGPIYGVGQCVKEKYGASQIASVAKISQGFETYSDRCLCDVHNMLYVITYCWCQFQTSPLRYTLH